jgi:negative regulator of flagellin synthesis FlgM
MKIGHLDSTHAATPAAGERGTTAQKTGGDATEASAQVALSDTASLLSGAATTPEFDADKVSRIAQAIRDGKFQVNHEAIADKLIANAQELLSKVSH